MVLKIYNLCLVVRQNLFFTKGQYVMPLESPMHITWPCSQNLDLPEIQT